MKFKGFQVSEGLQAKHVVVDEGHAGQRLDNFLLGQLKGAPRALIYRIVRTGEVRVNRGRARVDLRLALGDRVRVPPLRLAASTLPASPGQELATHLQSRILFEDAGLLVLDKPHGLAVHGGSGVQLGVIEALRALRPQYKFLELVHRLDRDTSGLLLVASQRQVLLALQAQLREEHMFKRYDTVLVGEVKGRRHRVERPLHKYVLPSGERRVRIDQQGKTARSDFQVQDVVGGLSFASVRIHTGRTHQIRVHAQSLGHPVLGDDKYGDARINACWREQGLARLFLHAAELELQLPGRGSLHFAAPAPEGFLDLSARLGVSL